jgi:tRNA threonylcarbamoyladenosine modification (KEOPS) complex Cgi121 subunit
MHEAVSAAGKLGAVLLLSPKIVRTGKELEAAFYLAKEAFAGKENIASSVAKEALLFLACETNFSSAIRKVGAASPDDFVIVAEGKIPSAKLKKLLKLTRAEALKLTEWGKKKGNYFEGELAVERMATARIRN